MFGTVTESPEEVRDSDLIHSGDAHNMTIETGWIAHAPIGGYARSLTGAEKWWQESEEWSIEVRGGEQ